MRRNKEKDKKSQMIPYGMAQRPLSLPKTCTGTKKQLRAYEVRHGVAQRPQNARERRGARLHLVCPTLRKYDGNYVLASITAVADIEL